MLVQTPHYPKNMSRIFTHHRLVKTALYVPLICRTLVYVLDTNTLVLVELVLGEDFIGILFILLQMSNIIEVLGCVVYNYPVLTKNLNRMRIHFFIQKRIMNCPQYSQQLKKLAGHNIGLCLFFALLLL